MATDFSYLIDPSYSSLVGARPSSSNPGVAEFYNSQTQTPFTRPEDLANFLQVQLGRSDINPTNVFDILKTPTSTGATQLPTSTAPTDPKQALAEEAARAGLSLDDYMKLVSTQTNPTPVDRNAINKNLGIDTLEQQVFAPPSKTTEQLYTDAYNAAGLADLKAKIAGLDKTIADIKAKYTSKAGDINENPFLSEASRVGRLRNLDDRLQGEIGNLIDEQKQYVDLYNSGINEVNGLVSRQTADFSNSQQLNQSKLQYLLQKAEQQYADAQGKQSTTTDFSYLPAYLEAKAKAQKPDVIGTAETGYFQYDPNSGTFVQISEPVVRQSSSGSSSSGSSSGSSGSTSFKFTNTQLANGAAAAGVSLQQFKSFDPDTQNNYINGAFSKLVGGRLSQTAFQKMQDEIDKALDQGEGIGQLREEIDNSQMPQQDKEELKQYVEDQARARESWFSKAIDFINPFD